MSQVPASQPTDKGWGTNGIVLYCVLPWDARDRPILDPRAFLPCAVKSNNALIRHPNRQTLRRIVKGFVGRNARIEVFGSSVCGFDTVLSDVDLTISIGGMPMASADQSDLLKRLSKALRFQHGMQVERLPAEAQVSILSMNFGSIQLFTQCYRCYKSELSHS